MTLTKVHRFMSVHITRNFCTVVFFYSSMNVTCLERFEIGRPYLLIHAYFYPFQARQGGEGEILLPPNKDMICPKSQTCGMFIVHPEMYQHSKRINFNIDWSSFSSGTWGFRRSPSRRIRSGTPSSSLSGSAGRWRRKENWWIPFYPPCPGRSWPPRGKAGCLEYPEDVLSGRPWN